MNRTRKTVILLCLVFLGLSYIYTAVYFQFSSSSNMGIIQPDIVLEQGTSGTSVVYSNGTSASISVDSYSTTFFPQDYNVNFGQYISGSTPASVNQIDSEYFKVNATGSSTANQVYYPLSMTLLNSTTNVFDWGINTSSFTSTATHTSYRYMGGTSPDIANMRVTKLHIRTNGAGTVAIGLYTGGTLNDPTGSSKQTEAYNVAVVAGWNEIDVPDYIWPQNTTSWIGWAHNTGVYYSDQFSDAGDFQTATGRWNQDIPADADETAAMPSSPTAGSFNMYWYAVYAEYEVGSLGNLTANDGVYMRLSSYLSAVTDSEDSVDNDTTDVDGSGDKGFNSNFTLQKIGPDSQYDTLREEYFGSISYDYVDNNITNVDSSQGLGTHSNFTAQKIGPDAEYDTVTESETGLVESVEELAINLSTSSTSNTASLTEATDTSQVVPFATRYVVTAGGTMDNHESTLIDLSISGTTLTASRYQADSKQVNTSIYCVEFSDEINVYSGTFTLSHGDATASTAIGANVSSSKSFLVFYYQADSTGNIHTDNAVRGNITSANQITFSRETSSGTISGHWWIAEDTGTNWNVDSVDVTVTETINNGIFDSVTMNKTMVIGSYSGGYSDDIIYGGASIYLSSPTQVSVVRGGSSGSIEATIYIIEFTGETTVQRGDISYTGAQTSLTDPVSSVSLGDSMAWIPTGWINTGHCISGGTGSSDNLDVMIRARLTSDTVITGERNNNGGNDAVLHWEVVEWERVSNVIDLEEQWTFVPDYYQGAEIVIKTGSFNGSEQLRIDFWNSSNQWMTLGNLSANSWNNYTIGSFLTSDNFTIRLKGTAEVADTAKDTWQIDAGIIRLLGQADGEIPVQFDTSDVDSSPNIGFHSNFTAHKLGPDASYDVLTETKYVNATLVDEEGFEDTWVPIGWSSTGGWSNETDQAHNGLVSADIDGVVNVTLIDNESFESWPPTGWTAGTYWNGETDEAHDGITSADIDGPGGSGDLDSPSFNCTDARALYLSFWFMDDDLDATNLILQFWDGLAWDNIQDLTGFSEDTWHYIEFNVSDSQYHIDDFQFRFAATNVGWGEHFYIDEVTLIREPTLGGPETSGILTTPSVNCTGARAVYVSFWFRDDGLDSGELDLEYWNGSAWNIIQDLTGYTENTWNYIELNVTDSQYYISDFKVRFSADTLGYNEHFYIDDVTITRETQVSSDEELEVEVQWTKLQNDLLYEELCIYAGTMGSEDIVVEVWNTTTLGWDTVFSDLTASSWNNVSITNWLTSDTLTIRYRGANSTGDTVKDQWEIDIALVHIWDNGTAEYSLDMEYQWTGVDFTESNEELCIYAGTLGAEDILVDVWNGTWNNVFTDLTPGWNNISVTQYLNSNKFTIRVRDGTTSSDALYDTWDIDISLLHLWGETYTAEIELEGTSNTYEWTQIEWTTDTSYTNSSIRVEIQLYNYTAAGYPITGNGFMNYTSGTADTDETKNQVITESPENFRNSTGGWKLKIKAEQNSPFDFNLDYIALDTTYYDEYTTQTEYLFTDITDSQSPNLNFTALTYNNLDGVNITLQVWNYTTTSYPTSGQGYLSYTSNEYKGWLSGFDQRVKLTLDADDIDSALSDFPVLTYLSTSSGRNSDDVSYIFDELQNDANRRKIAVTTSDGTTQCYVEIEEWDDASEEAWLWVKVPVVNNTVDTDLYLYYDADNADNTEYVGDPNSSPAESVWGNDYRFVTHMRDDPDTSHIRDSTGYDNDVTKVTAGEPAVTTSGNVSDAQSFDGGNDYLNTTPCPDSLKLLNTDFTIEAWAYPHNVAEENVYIANDWHTFSGGWGLGVFSDASIEVFIGHEKNTTAAGVVTQDQWNYITVAFDDSSQDVLFYKDGAWLNTESAPDEVGYTTGRPFTIGVDPRDLSGYEFDGILDEIRISNTSRSADWIKASYESGRDNLIDFGSPTQKGWLTGWDQRVKLMIDSNDVDSDLSDFPVLIHLSTSSGRNSDDVSFVFDELQNDANRLKIAVTSSDGTSQCYVEVEEWDDANEEAWLWVKAPNVNSAIDTTLYLYYDADHTPNTAYVGDPNSSPAESVWDNDFRLVSHMRDDPDTSSIRDSTEFDNDGTKTGANEPIITATGNMSQAQDFDGSDDYIDLGSDSSLDLRSSNLTIEAWIYPETQTTDWPTIYSVGAWELSLGIGQDTNTDKLEVWVNDNDDYASDSDVTYNAWNYVSLSWNSTHYNFFMDGDPDGSRSGSAYPDSGTVYIGGIPPWEDENCYNGTIDEVRVSNTSRSDAWISASFESGVDDLVDFGSEVNSSSYFTQLNPKWLNISINPSSCLNNTDAKIRVTAVYSTTQDYQNYVNFIRLLQDPIQKTHDYALRVKNLGVDTYNLRLVSLSETGLSRLINCTILLNSTTQIQVIDGTITLDTGTWTNIPGSGNQDIIVMASSINQDIPSTFELELEARKDTTTVVTYYPIMTKVQ